ncbi:MAG: dihydrofolate reductase [Nanoarchaeota archaeon]|nr:dihydrofolate reductase [Nanoarchaeota archaeon]
MGGIIIAALSENNVIGVNNKIPWYIPEDLTRFKKLTLNHPVLMGKNTWFSIPEKFRPLPKRKNIVLSKSLESIEGVHIARNIEEALGLTGNKEYYIMGGSQIYQQFLPLVDHMELTRIHQNFEGDSFFPKFDFESWDLLNEETRVSEKNIKYSFQSYLKI